MARVAVVLAGGTGTRLYPASTDATPKQFRAFGFDDSLLARTVDRARACADEVYVLTREAFADRIHEHAPDVGVLVEPEPKDTGPALAYAARRIDELHDDAVMLCLPADHHIAGDYAPVFDRATAVARETDGLVTLGVEPTRDATGYGYIQPGADHGRYFSVSAFHEKPDADTAARYREEGYLWNAGIFAWTPEAFLEACEGTELEPIATADDPRDGFAAAEAVSVDYAVLESSDEVLVVPATFDWDDLGAWDSLARILEGENATLGDTLAIDASDNVLAAGEGMSVSALGVSDLVVAAYDGNVVVLPKSEAQRVREIVESR
ncbi:mannose-1-phosphate guanylyltransferase [Natronomonas sp. EA1]|uniref:mannose-1-phosphate guanylyltransferase n=1 Tax=Natronomonas sp. EA1 TaxID=3421655 RepID=UPI003EBA41FD